MGDRGTPKDGLDSHPGTAQHPGSPMGLSSPLQVPWGVGDGVQGQCGEGWGSPRDQHCSTQRGTP